MKKLLPLCLICFCQLACNNGSESALENSVKPSAKVESTVDSEKTTIVEHKLQVQPKAKTEWEKKIDNAKKVDTKDVWGLLNQEAHDRSDEAVFKMSAEKLFSHMKSDPKAAAGFMFFKIQTTEDFEKHVKSEYATAKLVTLEKIEKEKKIKTHTIELGQELTIGNLNFKAKALEIRQFTYEKESYPKTIEVKTKPFLCLVASLKNISEGQIFAPVNSSYFRSSTYKDEYENRHGRPFYDMWDGPDVSNFMKDVELKPGKEIEVYFPFEVPKIENSSKFVLDLYVTSSNKGDDYVDDYLPDRSKAIIINFSRADITNFSK